MKFLTDGMLGKLTRWLRMLGHDVEYSTRLEDGQLLTRARYEKRILLTRDLGLYKQAIARGIETYYLEGRTEAERLSELAKRFSIELKINMLISRCPKCNTIVEPTSKEDVTDKLEANTLAHYDEFWQCPKCMKVYWQGAHWTKIGKTLEEARMRLLFQNEKV